MSADTQVDSPRAYVRAVLSDHPDADIYELARIAADAVEEQDLRLVLAAALVQVAREVVGDSRRDSMSNLGGGNRSPKQRGIANWWAKMLTEQVSVNGKWKTLRDCTFDDLQACIDEREQLISRVGGQIENYKRLQKLMVQHKAKQVSDVPAQTEWTDK